MEISGRTLKEHMKLLRPFLALVTAVFLIRFVVGLMGAPDMFFRLFSVGLAIALAVLLAVVVIHLRGFGGYANVVLSALLIVGWGELLIIGAVLFSVLTGVDTVYSLPEFSLGDDPYHAGHILGHVAGIGMGTLVGAATGCFLLFFMRLVTSTAGASR